MDENERREKEKQEDLRMIKDPNTWGCWPILPMKKATGEGERPVGFLLATGKPKLYLRNFLDLRGIGVQTVKEIDEKVQSREYVSFEAILDDGWIID